MTFLVVSLLLLVSGVDRAIDQWTTQSTQGLFFVYDDKGDVVYSTSYQGNLALYDRIVHPWRAAARIQAHPGIIPRA